jgi:tetratricopeptide (TPR) repeat protein
MANGSRRGLDVQLILAFAFGTVFVVVLLFIAFVTPMPSDFQIFVYRVVMALAAAGIGAIIPGFIVVNISNFVRAGGAIACFVVVYLVNPPTLASQQLRSQSYFDLMDRGESSLAYGNTTQAKHLFSAAADISPDASLPYLKLASAYFDGGEFESAKLNYRMAFDKSDPKDATLLYGAALSEEALNELTTAVSTFEGISKTVHSDREYYSDVIFSIGQLKLKLWQQNISDLSLYQAALNNFKTFLEPSGGTPKYWAHYHLACLYAMRGTIESVQKNKLAFNNMAIDELKAAAQGVKASRSQKADLHMRMLVQVFSGAIENWAPGNPVICPALQALSKEQYPIEKMISPAG